MKLLRSLFGRTPIRPGDIFVFDSDKYKGNPFAKGNPHRVKVLAVKDGWVNYRWCGPTIWDNESMRVGNFRFCYKKVS